MSFIISIKHLVVLFNRSIFVNSLGECILLGNIVLPIQIESTDRYSLKRYIGPVPGEEIFIITSLKIFFAASATRLIYSLPIGVLYAGSPLTKEILTSL